VPDDGRQVLSIPATTHGRVLVRHAPTEPPRGILAGFHGYMENAAAQLARLETLPGAEAWTLVSIQGLHRFYRGRSQDVVASWMTREDRETAIADNVQYVRASIAAVTGAASPPIVYAGFSQGVAMAFRAAAHAQQPAAGVIAVGGDVPPELLADVALKFPRVFLARGAADDWYTAVKLETDAAALRARGTDVRELVYAGGHEWTPEIAEAAAAWLGL
jgi:predicted esterase